MREGETKRDIGKTDRARKKEREKGREKGRETDRERGRRNR